MALRLAGTPIGPNDTAIAGHAAFRFKKLIYSECYSERKYFLRPQPAHLVFLICYTPRLQSVQTVTNASGRSSLSAKLNPHGQDYTPEAR
ncbi:hypothetical protein DP876_21370 [Salmonella enterica subsp. enterica serovar Muenchen]|nr:hypothetical protein [Salmonella enterica]EBQ9649023.1 hypothetical protein [Salmonella enterica subsp. enterica serovar Montevideo]EBW7050001.1 hypothetical protein [Salmonella enterica subsp. enterica serovar Muenchen]EDH6439983.1 hypothetical protein [Salmonella enterica subsp. enterica serovar Brandenburg]EBX1258545.1 hypothetical protein [Salmonella enterica subsp. enterica serovar Montevideo]